MEARGLRFDLLVDYDTALSCEAFHIDAADPYLEKGTDSEGFPCLPLLPRAMSEGDSDNQNPRSEKVRQVCCRCRTADDWSLRTGRQPEGPLRRTGQFTRHIVCHDPEERKDGPLLTPIMKPHCSTGPQYGRTAENSATSDPSLTLARCRPPRRLYL